MGEYVPSAEKLPLLNVETVKPSSLSSVGGSIFTLTNTILGSGTLAVPYAIASSGWLVGMIVMLIIALITRYSVRLLLQASDLAGPNCSKTYESLGHYTMGKYGTWLAEFTFIFGGFGTLVSYLIFISSLFCAVAELDSSYKAMTMTVCTFLVIMPLSLSRTIGKLQLTSLLATLSVAYVVSFCLGAYVFLFQSPAIPRPNVEAVQLNSGSVYTVTLLIAAFACHNTTLPVYEELRDRSLERMTRAICGAISIAFFLYTIIGISGYLSFGADTMDNILLNYDAVAHPSIKTALKLGQFCMAFALLLTCPIALWPFRSCICSLYLRLRHGRQLPSSSTSYIEWICITLIAEGLILLSAVFIPSVKTPLSIVGSVSGSLIIFIMPSLFFMLLQPYPLLSRPNFGPMLLFTVGIFVGLIGFSMTMYKLVVY